MKKKKKKNFMERSIKRAGERSNRSLGNSNHDEGKVAVSWIKELDASISYRHSRLKQDTSE